MWIGTYSAGVNFQSRYKNKFKKYVSNPLDSNSLSYKNVTAFLEDRDGDIWIGTDGGGLNRFNPVTEEFEHFRMDPSNPDWLQTDVIIHLMEDDEGDIYISSYNHGLTIFNKNEMTFKQYLPNDTVPTSIAGIHPWYTFQDSYGSIWVGMLAVGLDKFDKSTGMFKNYGSVVDDPTTLNSPNIKIIYEDKDHRLWIGTEGGGLNLYNREEDNFTRYSYDAENKNAISNDDIRALYEDQKGRFWVGTSKGLCLMNRDSGTFKSYFVEDGLPGNTIDGILEDNNGYLWLSTDAGISKFNPDDLTFRNYDRTDGLQGNEFNYTASIIASDGSFYFGGKNGFNVFKPEEIMDNPYPPDIVITGIEILNKPYTTYLVKRRGKKINRAVSLITKFKFSHKQNILSFKFAALDYGNSAKNQYKYMLEGFDKEWNKTDASKRFATYTNLPGGDYVFRVIASNGDGIWNEEGLSIKITITPPFYKRTWFILLVLAVIIWLVIRYIRRREEVLMRDKENLEKKIQEGLKEVNKQKEEVAQKDKILQEKIESEKEQNWYNIGMSKMSEVMSKHKDDLHQLAQRIITEIVEYIEVQQGAIYLLNDEDEGDKYLELLASYAPDDKRLIGTRIDLDEGQVGTCYKEMSVIKVDNLPDDYALFSSGLGELPLKDLVVIPLRLNEIVIGVVELLSFAPVPQYRIEFVEKSGETLTSILTALKANFRTQKLLEKQKLQAEELGAQEEELRQNLEEMQATQEELGRMKEIERKNEEERKKAEKKLMDQLKKQNEELNFEKSLIDALMANVPNYIYFKDRNSKFIKASLSLAKMFKLKNPEGLIGKSDFDFFDDEHAKPAYKDEQNIIKTEKPIINLIEKEVKKDGSISYVNTSKMPLYSQDGKIIGTFGISTDITESKQLEAEIQMRNEELQAQEEELRQNLEEMQATQDELLRMREIEQHQHEELNFEKSLMDALLTYIPNYIYFKDLDSKFIKVSLSHVRAFNLKSPDELIGKSDFDFFDEEHAKPAYDDEQKIVKTKKPIIDLIEKEVKKNGSIRYVNTSKMPLYDKNGKVIGTFGISTDITESKLLETEIQMRNEELQAQEEELRQNLEEMQATQDELTRMREIEGQISEQLKIQNDELQNKQTALEKEQYLFNALLNSANEHIYFKDNKSRFIRLSKSMLKLFKVKSLNELLGKSDFDFFDEAHAKPAFEGEQKIIKSGKPIVDLVEKEVHKDGSVSWVSTSKMPLKDKKGNIVGTWGISKDITDTKILEEEINRSKERLFIYEQMLHALINNLPGRVVVTDSDGIVYKANDAFARSIKKKMKDVEKITMLNLLQDKEQKQQFKDKLAEVKKKGKIEWTEKDIGKTEVRKQFIKLTIEELKKDYFLLLEM